MLFASVHESSLTIVFESIATSGLVRFRLVLGRAWMFHFPHTNISVHADGEHQRPRQVRACLRIRLVEDLSDAAARIRPSPSAFAVGVLPSKKSSMLGSRLKLQRKEAERAARPHDESGRRPSAVFAISRSMPTATAEGPCRSERT